MKNRKLLWWVGCASALVAFGLAALIGRGFRANSTPSRLERSVARAVRNFAIPRRERAARNPVPGNTEALQQGRTEFLTRCAACHGIDGSGKTEMGANLYPRVPDLREEATQALSDGELHYIIENGVALTGMPAWRNAQRDANGAIWNLVVFVRSLRPLTREELTQQAGFGSSAHYVGSAACEKCHAEIYARWKKTPMASVVRDPRAHPEAILPKLESDPVAKFGVDQVALVYGSIWKQRYFTKVGDDYYPLPAQWVVGAKKWLPYKVPAGGDWWVEFYPPDNMRRPTGPTCDGCHSVDYNIHTKKVAEWNVGCEACHGPGSEHAAHGTRANILNPGRMDSLAANDTCIRCHSQGRPLTVPLEGRYYDWPVGYRVGLQLQDFWKLEDCTLGQTSFYYFPDCTAHKNRMQGNDFVQSVMYRHGITCASCHDVHGTENPAQLRARGNDLCLECHGPGSPNGPREAAAEEHSHHRAGSTGNECIACHMPKIESEGVPGAFVHAHTFRFIGPTMTEQAKIPSPCMSCHAEKTTAWAREAMSGWGWSPWRVR